jgi:hypothetical protein
MSAQNERLARIQRDLVELRARAIRIQGEADATYRQVRELEVEVVELVKESEVGK